MDNMNLKDIQEDYTKKKKAYWARQRKIQAEIEALEKKKNDMKHPHYMDVLEKLGKALKERLGGDKIETYGPFGLSSECSVYVEKEGQTLASLTFISSDGGFAIRDYSKVDHKYPERSIGAMNGFQYGTIKLTEKHDFEWLVKFATKGHKKKKKKVA